MNTLSTFDNCIICNELRTTPKRLYLIIGAVNRIKITHLDMILRWIKAGARVITTCPILLIHLVRGFQP